MAFFAKQRIFFYKRYKLDIWGVYKNSLQWIIDKTNYYSFYLKKKQRKTMRNLRNFKKQLNRQIKNFKFIIGQKFTYNDLLKDKIDIYIDNFFNPLDVMDYLRTINKFKIKKGLNFWYVKISKFFKSKHEILVLKKDIKVTYIVYYYIRIIIRFFFKITISKKMEHSFFFLFVRKPPRPKIYFRTPFLYDIRLYPPRVKKKKENIEFITLRVTKLFYVMYSYRQLKRLARKAKNKIGIFEQNYLLFMECKFPSFIFRTSFLQNIFESIKFVKSSNIWINKLFIRYMHYTVKPLDLIGFRIWIKGFLFWNYYKRLRRRAFIFLFPKNMYISTIFFFIFFLKIPLKDDLINPIQVDMYRLYNYAI